MARLTKRETEALRAAVVLAQVDLEDRADHGESVGHELAALQRAWTKVYQQMGSDR